MENLTLKLKIGRRHYSGRKATNLNLDKGLTKNATGVAFDRYGWSLSELVNQLLILEVESKSGLLDFVHQPARVGPPRKRK